MFSNRVEAEKIFKKMDFENIKDFDDIGFYVLPRETEGYYDIRKANEYIKKIILRMVWVKKNWKCLE